jgi:chorismate mutase
MSELATAAAVPPAPYGPAPDDDVTALIHDLRSQIDDVDQAILTLLATRRGLSRQVQDARVAAGGVRIELNRERQILTTYGAALGSHGVALATAVLRSCRGGR